MHALMFFEGKQVELFKLGEEIYFNPYDIGNCLGVLETDVREVLSIMSSEQVVKLTNSDVASTDIEALDNSGKDFLTVKGLYNLVLHYRTEVAERFTDWVTVEILPAVRVHAPYIAGSPEEIIAKLTQSLFATLNALERANDGLRTYSDLLDRKEKMIQFLTDTSNKSDTRITNTHLKGFWGSPS